MHNKPLLQYILNAAKGSTLLDRIYVSTDCDEIARFAEMEGVLVNRHDPRLSGPQMPSFGVVHSLALDLRAVDELPDAFLVLRATSPLLQIEHIQEAITILCSRTDSDSIVSVVQAPMHPKKFLLIDSEGFLAPYDRSSPEADSHVPVQRQNFESVWMRTAALYLSQTNVILNGRMWGDHCLPLPIPRRYSININTEDDWYIAESILARIPTTFQGYKLL